MNEQENTENVLEGHCDRQGGVPEYSHWLGTSTLEDTGPTQREIESKKFHLPSTFLIPFGWGGGELPQKKTQVYRWIFILPAV